LSIAFYKVGIEHRNKAAKKGFWVKKGQTAMEYLMTYGCAILIIMVIMAVLFYLGVLNPSNLTPTQCTFPAGFSCVTNKLQTGTSKLYLVVSQGTGHNIQINGINCTQQTDASKMTAAIINYSNYPQTGGCAAGQSINLTSGAKATLADAIGVNASANGCPANSTAIICSTSTGVTPGDMGIGSLYSGNIYISYTELDTGLSRIVVGTYSARFEA
jgi:hypothetical protein